MAELSELSEKLSGIRSEIENDLTTITSSKGVYEYRKSVMDSKEGKIGSLMKEMGKIPKELSQGCWDGSEKERELDKLIGWDFNYYRTVGSSNGLSPAFESKVL